VISPQVQLGGTIPELSAPDDIAEDDVDITEEDNDDGGIFSQTMSCSFTKCRFSLQYG
jgi:hypothetical protein